MLTVCVSTQRDNEIKAVIKNNIADIYIFPEFALTGDILIEEVGKYGKNVFLGAAIKEDNDIFDEYVYISKDDNLLTYKKTHLGEKENKYYTAGNELTVMKVEDVSYGIAMCIESHMPSISQSLCKNGAEVLIFPFATPIVCGDRSEIWSKYIPARAYDNNAYVIATNLYGGMMVVSPNGEIINENYSDDTMIVKIDTEEVKKRRSKYKLDYNGRVRTEVLGNVKV